MPDYPKLGRWREGMNTLLTKNELPDDALRSAVNVDITDEGLTRRRSGSSRIITGTIARGTLETVAGRTLFVESGSLRELYQWPDGSWSSLLIRADVGNKPMAYTEVGGEIYWTNGVFTGRIDAAGRDWGWGVHPPPHQPNVDSGASGSLIPGTYQVAITYVAENGEESGTPLASVIEITETGSSIVLRDFPLPRDPKASIRIYCSHPNGEGLYWVGDMPQGAPLYEIDVVSNAATVLLQTQFGVAPPAGTALEAHNGRIYIARGNIVWITEPLRYGLVKPLQGFLQFPSDVTVIKAVSDGVFICADRTYWIEGMDTEDLEQSVVLPYGAVYGTGMNIPQFDAVAWFSDKGMVIAGLNGEVHNTMEDRVAVSKYGAGSMFWREQDGIRSVVASLRDAEITPFMTPDYEALETARGGDFA